MTEENLKAVTGDEPAPTAFKGKQKNPNLQARTPEQLAVLEKARLKAVQVRKENAELKRKEKELAKVEKEKEKAERKKKIESKYKQLKETKTELVEEEYIPNPPQEKAPSPIETEVDEPAPKLERQKPVKKTKKKVIVVEESESEEEEEIVYVKKKPSRTTGSRQRRVQYVEEPRRDSNPPEPSPQLINRQRLYDAFIRGHY